MNKAIVPISSDIISTKKGSAAPVAFPTAAPAPKNETAEAASIPATPANDPKPKATKSTEAEEPMVTHNFRVKKSFKKDFDRAALEADMNNVTFLQYLFKFYQEHQPRR